MIDRDRDVARLNELLDRHGGDLSAWPDKAAAQWARELALADREARRALDEARRLDDLLQARAEAFAEDRALAERTAAAVTPALAPRRGETRRSLIRLAASFVIAAFVGGAVGQLAQPDFAEDEAELAMLDSLLYGPGEGELR